MHARTDEPEPKGGGASGKREPTSVRAALKQSLGPVLRQLRKYEAMKAFLTVLPAEIADQAAPSDIRLMSPADDPGGLAEVNTMVVWAASATVATVVERLKRQLIEQVNAKLAYPMVEELKIEVVALAKVQKQVNILRLQPD